MVYSSAISSWSQDWSHETVVIKHLTRPSVNVTMLQYHWTGGVPETSTISIVRVYGNDR